MAAGARLCTDLTAERNRLYEPFEPTLETRKAPREQGFDRGGRYWARTSPQIARFRRPRYARGYAPHGHGRAVKSELLSSITALWDVHPAATLTEASLLSGTPRRERDKDAKGGLLRAIGDYGILLLKDFGSVLSMHRDARAAVLAALREVYDGSWTRHVGTDGGQTLEWSGKVGLLAGCTPTIDRHHGVMGTMGERFVLFRLPEIDSEEQAERSLAHAGRESEMRTELSGAVSKLLERPLSDARPLNDEEKARLVTLSTFAVRCRSSVERDGYSREIELIPPPEAPARLVVVLERLLSGLDSIGVERADAWRVVAKAALDSIPAIRRSLVETLARHDEAAETSAIAEALDYPTTTARRALEDLAAHGVARRFKQGQGKADTWSLSAWARKRVETFPEMSSNVRSGELRKSLIPHPTFRERSPRS